MPAPENNLAKFQDLIQQQHWEEIQRILPTLDPADLADLLEELDPDERDAIFEHLDLQTASDVLSELESPVVEEMVEEMSSDKLADLAEKMPPDEAAELLADLDEPHTAEVLAAMEPEERREVSQLLRYPENSAGRIMTPETCAVSPQTRVRDVLEILGETELSDPVFNVYVVDPADHKFLGVVRLDDLMKADPDAAVGDIAQRDYPFASAMEDQEEVARRFQKYHLVAIPVLDENHRLLGRITADDAMEVVQEEAEEDIARLVGAPDIEEEEVSPLRIARLRLPWLLITLCTELVIGVVVSRLLRLTQVVAIALFVPAILAMGGNTGQQSSTITVRGIALGGKAYRKLKSIVWREVRVGLSLGLVCGLFSGGLVWGILHFNRMATGPYSPLRLGLTVGLAMCNAMVFGSAYGCLVPMLVHRLGVDPALASGPFVSTSNDLSATFIYFATCALLLGIGTS